jgi:hypothetical protein
MPVVSLKLLIIQASLGDDARILHVSRGYFITLALVVKNATPVSSIGYCISFAPQYTQGNLFSVQLGGFVVGGDSTQYEGFVKLFGSCNVNLTAPGIGGSCIA